MSCKQIIIFDFSCSPGENDVYTAAASCTFCQWSKQKITSNALTNRLHEEELTDLALAHADEHFKKCPEKFLKGDDHAHQA